LSNVSFLIFSNRTGYLYQLSTLSLPGRLTPTYLRESIATQQLPICLYPRIKLTTTTCTTRTASAYCLRETNVHIRWLNNSTYSAVTAISYCTTCIELSGIVNIKCTKTKTKPQQKMNQTRLYHIT